MGEVGYSKSQPQESKFDFRAIVGQQFFFFFSSSSRASFSFSLPLLFHPLPHLRYRQRGEGESSQARSCANSSRVVFAGRAGIASDSWLFIIPGLLLRRDGELAERKTERVGGGERMEECIWRGGGKRAKETRWMEVEVRERELPSENIENRAYHSQQNSDCFSWDCHQMLLTLKIIHKFSRLVLLSIPFESSAFFFYFIFIYENNC